MQKIYKPKDETCIQELLFMLFHPTGKPYTNKRMNNRILVILASALIALNSFSQDTKDTIPQYNTDTLFTYFHRNLDSMMNLWYIKQAETCKYLTRPPANRDTNFIPQFPDSVLLRRIASMNSVIDLSYNSRVKAFIDLYANRRREQVEVMLGLSEYYFPMFEQIFDEEGVPPELKYLSIIESALNPRARSRANAVGLWQFMYATGKMYGLQADSFVDDRQDPIKATQAAARFLKSLHNTFGDWVLALAAYNCGPGNVRKAINRSGGKRNYWDIYNHLPRETRGYVPAFIAASYVMTYHEEHNLYPRNTDLPIPVDTIMVSEKIHLKQIAEVMKIPIQEIRDINPQYRIDIIPASIEKPYALILPSEITAQFLTLADSIVNYKDSIFFNPDNIVKAPPVYNGYSPVSPKGQTKIVYTVKSGDNLGYISQLYNVSIQDIRYWNGIRGNMIRVGQHLSIYKNPSEAAKYSNIKSNNFTPTTTSKPATTTVADGNYIYHTVTSGDTLWGIARQYAGVSEQDIINLNSLSDASKLALGQKLKIKKK